MIWSMAPRHGCGYEEVSGGVVGRRGEIPWPLSLSQFPCSSQTPRRRTTNPETAVNPGNHLVDGKRTLFMSTLPNRSFASVPSFVQKPTHDALRSSEIVLFSSGTPINLAKRLL